MPVHNYGNDLFVLTVNGRRLTDWGQAATPYTDDPIDPRRQLIRAQGGNGISTERSNPGRVMNVFLNPGGADSAYMQALYNSGATIECSKQQVGTLEVATGIEGIIVNDGQSGRGGSTITDDQYTIEFNVWNENKGGE